MFQISLPMIHVWLSIAAKKGPVAALTTLASSEAAAATKEIFMLMGMNLGS
jgi:hypothetical protein